jgi:hypothetical protein
MQSRRTRFTTAAALANELVEAKDQRMLSRVIGRYARYDLLVLDELAYVPLSATEAELLFQVLDRDAASKKPGTEATIHCSGTRPASPPLGRRSYQQHREVQLDGGGDETGPPRYRPRFGPARFYGCGAGDSAGFDRTRE